MQANLWPRAVRQFWPEVGFPAGGVECTRLLRRAWDVRHIMGAMDVEEQAWALRWLDEWANRRYGEATDLLHDLINDDPDAAWGHVLVLIREAPNDHLLNCVGAGPLEGLLCAHGPAFVDRVEELAAHDEKFKKSLRWVWGELRMDHTTLQRVLRARE